MQLRYNYRVYPTPGQQQALARAFGCARVVFDGPKPLSVRSWECLCGAVHDRDVNAAKNVLAAGRAKSLNACGAQVRPAPVPARRREAGIRSDAVRCSARSVEEISVLRSERKSSSGK